MTINAFLSEKKPHYVLRSISAEAFIFLSGEGVPCKREQLLRAFLKAYVIG